MNWTLKPEDVWSIAGWTMLHYLWVGLVVALVAGLSKLLLQFPPLNRLGCNARYALALGCLAVLALMPLFVATWVASHYVATSVTATTETEPARLPAKETTETIELAALTDYEEPVILIETGKPIEAASDVPQIRRSGSSARAAQWTTSVLAAVTHFLPWLWLVGTPLTFGWLATGMIGAERLRTNAQLIVAGDIARQWYALANELRSAQRATIAVCERVASPILVGVLRPTILLPSAAITGWEVQTFEQPAGAGSPYLVRDHVGRVRAEVTFDDAALPDRSPDSAVVLVATVRTQKTREAWFTNRLNNTEVRLAKGDELQVGGQRFVISRVDRRSVELDTSDGRRSRLAVLVKVLSGDDRNQSRFAARTFAAVAALNVISPPASGGYVAVTLADSNDERAARKLLRQLPADPEKAIPMLVQLLSHESNSVTKHVEALLIRFGEATRANLEEAVSNLPENSVARTKATRVLKAIEEGSNR